jgi:hypothetical protein
MYLREALREGVVGTPGEMVVAYPGSGGSSLSPQTREEFLRLLSRQNRKACGDDASQDTESRRGGGGEIVSVTHWRTISQEDGKMKGIKTVDDLIQAKGLSDEEKEKLRNIIQECRVRETKIKEASESARRNLEGLSKTFGLVMDTISSIGKAVDDLHEEVERLQLKMMPEEQFYQA